jgi:hypothetical protein
MLKHVLLDPYFDGNLLARRTEGYSPSNICMVLKAAVLYPFKEAWGGGCC